MAVAMTISTPVTLGQYAESLSQDSPERVFVENMVKESDLMRTVPILPVTAGKKEFMDIARTPTVGFRAINAAGNQDTGSFNLRSEDTFFIDEYVYVDRALIDRLGMQHKFEQQRLKTIALAQMFSSKFINGDNSSANTEPNGLKVRCTITSGSTQNLFSAGNTSGGDALSLALLDQLYWSVNKPTHYIFPRSLMYRLDAAARSNSLTNTVISMDMGDFGRVIYKYKGLPILYGYDPDDTPDLIPLTETGAGGGTAQTGSIYCVSLREGGLYAIEQTPLTVKDEGPIPGTPQDSTHIKWDWGIAREHPRAVSRLYGVKDAAFVA